MKRLFKSILYPVVFVCMPVVLVLAIPLMLIASFVLAAMAFTIALIDGDAAANRFSEKWSKRLFGEY